MSDGRFVWYDLLTTDVEAAKAFYSEVVGWKTMPWGNGDYTMWAVGERPIGGVLALPEEAKAMGAPPHWCGFIAVADVDASTARAVELGGRNLKEPSDIPTVGRFSVMMDPQGAVFALFRGEGEMPAVEPGVGDVCWHELALDDRVSGFAYYQQLFDWHAGEAMDMGPAGVYQMFTYGERTIGGAYTKPAEMPAPPNWLYYFSVSEIHSAVERIGRLGGQVVMGPHEIPGGDLIVMCLDPQGAAFALHCAVAKG